MKLEIVKKGQGKRARWIAYALCGGLVLFGAIAFFGTINKPGKNVWVEGVPVIGEITLYNVLAFVVFSIGLLVVHLALNRAQLVDLLIDTEQEMKKVSWPSKKEVQSATLIVVLVTFILAIMLYGFDYLLQMAFRLVLGA